eukprot:1178397-Prorocentrum_minimum.AAC.4
MKYVQAPPRRGGHACGGSPHGMPRRSRPQTDAPARQEETDTPSPSRSAPTLSRYRPAVY